MHKVETKQQGVISFLSVIFISLLLIIITTGFIRVMVNEQRQSTDIDQSTKAYFAAEAGVEDAISQLSGPTTPTFNDCNAFGVAHTGGIIKNEPNIGVTCQLIDDNYPANAELNVSPGETAEVSLENADPNTRYVQLAWYTDPLSVASYPAAGENLTPANWEAAGLPAMLRVAIVQWPQGNFDHDDVATRAFMLYPSDDATVPTYSLSSADATTQNAVGSGSQASLYDNISCVDAGRQYKCHAIIDLGVTIGSPGAPFTQFNIKALNSGSDATPLQVTACTNSDCSNIVSINQDVYLIDVTAGAGDIFRRVRTQYIAGSEYSRNRYGYDYVIYGDEQVCKNLEISRQADGTETGAGSLPSC